MAILDHHSKASLRSYKARPSTNQLEAFSFYCDLSHVLFRTSREMKLSSPSELNISRGNILAAAISLYSQNPSQQFVKPQTQAVSILFVRNMQVA